MCYYFNVYLSPADGVFFIYNIKKNVIIYLIRYTAMHLPCVLLLILCS